MKFWDRTLRRGLRSQVVEIRFDDYAHAPARAITLDLKKSGDREGIITKIRP